MRKSFGEIHVISQNYRPTVSEIYAVGQFSLNVNKNYMKTRL